MLSGVHRWSSCCPTTAAIPSWRTRCKTRIKTFWEKAQIVTGEPPDLMSTRTAPTRKHRARTRKEGCRTKQHPWRLGRDDMSELAATIAAQRGPQTEFLRSPADICIYGG